MYTTYSFNDVSAVVSHPSFGQKTAQGEGLGSVTVEMTTDRTAQDMAADGSVMISKIEGRNGTVTFAIQQTSSFGQWLQKLYNYLEAANTDKWAGITITIRAPRMNEQQICTGVAFTKLPSNPKQAQGQMRNWVLMAADIQQDVI